MSPPLYDADGIPYLSACIRIFQFLLPIALGLGLAAIMAGVVITHFIPVPELAEAADPGLHAAGEITAAVGYSTVGFFGVTHKVCSEWIRHKYYKNSHRQDDKDSATALTKAVVGCLIFLLAASYFNISGERFAIPMLGLRIGLFALGAVFSVGAVVVSVIMYKDYSPTPSKIDEETAKLLQDAEENPLQWAKVWEELDDTKILDCLASDESRVTVMSCDDSTDNPSDAAKSGSHSRPTIETPARRLANSAEFVVNTTGIVSSIGVALASLLIWYLYLRGCQTKLEPPRRRTTIIKKRPTFFKGKRRATHKPTLSSLRSEGNLVPLS